MENSSAFVSGNAIFQNIKANIAFGGKSAENTVIIGNMIFSSSSEGIFLMLSGRCIVYNNKIYDNYNGIVVMEATPDISYNEIYGNKNNGILVLRASELVMRFNSIHGNQGVGLLLREKSRGEIERNDSVDNELDLAIEYYGDWIEDMTKINKFGEGRVRLPEKQKCALI